MVDGHGRWSWTMVMDNGLVHTHFDSLHKAFEINKTQIRIIFQVGEDQNLKETKGLYYKKHYCHMLAKKNVMKETSIISGNHRLPKICYVQVLTKERFLVAKEIPGDLSFAKNI